MPGLQGVVESAAGLTVKFESRSLVAFAPFVLGHGIERDAPVVRSIAQTLIGFRGQLEMLQGQ